MIKVTNLCVKAGAFELKNVSFEVPSRSYAVLMGKTGSGKTTILEIVCGLRSGSGSIQLMGREVGGLIPGMRGVGYVPQDAVLFQTMTVREHLAFALLIRKWDSGAITRRVDELADLLGIGKLLDRKPKGLSGGEMQRVALGRALSFEPGVLCMDEPLSALDEETREEMYKLLRSVCTQTHVTTLHISHSTSEARRLADRVLVLKDGVVVECPELARDAARPEKIIKLESATG